jgi:dTDP-glucose 4,6-dehydratase
MRILITGGSGVIGLNLTSDYINTYGLSNEITSLHIREIPAMILSDVDPNLQVKHVTSLANIEIGSKFDLIINASGVSQPNLFTKDPERIVQSNINDALELFKFLDASGTFIQMSTSEIYSGCEDRPCSEEHRGKIDASNPRRIYMMTKEVSELALRNIASSEQTVLILRISLVFGKYYLPPDERVLYSFIEQSLRGVVVPKGGLENIRRYLNSSDLFSYVESLRKNLSAGFHVYNVGSEDRITIGELAAQVAKISGAKLQLESTRVSQSGAPNEVWVDASKLLNTTGIFPKTDLEEGLRQVIDWRKQLDFRG